MNQNIQQLKALFETLLPEDGMMQTAISALFMHRSSFESVTCCSLYEPSVCFIISGDKEVFLENELYHCHAGTFLVTAIHLPLKNSITQVSKERPYLGLKLQFSMNDVIHVAQEVQKQAITPYCQISCDRGLYMGSTDEGMQEALIRLLLLLKEPKSIPFLAPLIIQEILFRLVVHNPQYFIKQFAQVGSYSNRMFEVIQEINSHFDKPLKIDKLAKKAGMSLSLFHRNFKNITAMSPIQYQKKLRLQEARKLLLTHHASSSEVAFEVGYLSPSQFSREYTRMFGLPPMQDSKRATSV